MRRGLAGRLVIAHGAGVAVALMATAGLAPARAAAAESLTASGSFTYTWQGDPARGCAAENLCGVEGALVVKPQGGASTTTDHGTTQVGLALSGGTVRVLGAPGAPGEECVDVPGDIGASALSINHGPDGQPVAQIQPPPSSGRCAGPTQQDLAQITIPVSETGTKRPSFDLRTTQTFDAGPFTGTLVSTVVLRAGGSGLFSSSTSTESGSFFGPTPLTHKVLLERVTLRYRLASLPGVLDMAFGGAADPLCTALGSCGATGTLALSLAGLNRTLSITASRVVRRRVSRRQALEDLRRGRLHLEVGVPQVVPETPTTQVTETFQSPDGLSCADTTTARGALLVLDGAPDGRGLLATLSDENGAGLVRTHCPGPADSDVFGTNPGNPFGEGGGDVASGSIAAAALTSPRTVVSLGTPGSFTGFGYAGTRSGAIPISLSLERVVQAGTIQVAR